MAFTLEDGKSNGKQGNGGGLLNLGPSPIGGSTKSSRPSSFGPGSYTVDEGGGGFSGAAPTRDSGLYPM